jgi:hypothetical protein
VNLSDLRPTLPTGLSELSRSLRGRGAKLAAMPSALPEAFLLSVARDLRFLEECEGDEHSAGYLAAPMMLVMCLHLGNLNKGSKITLGEGALHRSLRIYQWAIEREILKRLVGKGGLTDEDTLLEGLEEARLTTD